MTISPETTSQDVNCVLAFQLATAMQKDDVSKLAMAKRLDTSRAQLDRILDPENDRVSLHILIKAAKALGRQLSIELR